MSTVIRIEKRRPAIALENLNRLTGLDFDGWPESLLDGGHGIEPCSEAETSAPDQSATGDGRYVGGQRQLQRR